MREASSSDPIVVGVEGTPRSADALAFAAVLADRLDCPLLVVHAHPYGQLSGILGEGEYERLVRGVADTTFHQVKQQLGEHEREMRLISARSPAAGLQEVAESEHARMIAVGASHHSGLGRVRPGSVGERLLSGSPVPVAIAPAGYAQAEQRLRAVACAFDGSAESRLALDWAIQLAEAGESRLLVISVHSPIAFGHVPVGGAFSPESVNRALRSELEREQRAALADLDRQAESVVREGDPAQTLVSASQEADIMVMGSRGYGPLRATLLGGVSQRVVRDARCPVIICPRASGPRQLRADEGVST